MNMLIIYDSNGYVISQMSGAVREPVGIPFIWIEIPVGKRIKLTDGIGVDVTVSPNVAILEDIPKTVEEVLSERLASAEDAINMLMMS